MTVNIDFSSTATVARLHELSADAASTQGVPPSRLVENYGASQVSDAGYNEFVMATGQAYIEGVRQSDMPPAMKDKLISGAEDWMQSELRPVDPGCAAAVAGSDYGKDWAKIGSDVSGGTMDRALEGPSETTGGGQSTAADADRSMDDVMRETMEATASLGDDEDKKSARGGGKGGKSGGSMIMQIARELGKLQDDFLQMAMDSLNQMKAEAGNVTAGSSGGGAEGSGGGGEGSPGFMTAQSEFQAYMKLFDITSQAASNGIKTLGEAAANMARKQ